MQLSAHFWLHEFIVSQAATRAGLDNTPGAQEIENLSRLCCEVLEPTRELLDGRVITVSSGYRAPRVNALIGGAVNSAHLEGRAADILVQGLAPFQVCLRLETRRAIPDLDQCIFEGSWTHLAVAPPTTAPRGEFLTAHFKTGGVSYSKGILA